MQREGLQPTELIAPAPAKPGSKGGRKRSAAAPATNMGQELERKPFQKRARRPHSATPQRMALGPKFAPPDLGAQPGTQPQAAPSGSDQGSSRAVQLPEAVLLGGHAGTEVLQQQQQQSQQQQDQQPCINGAPMITVGLDQEPSSDIGGAAVLGLPLCKTVASWCHF